MLSGDRREIKVSAREQIISASSGLLFDQIRAIWDYRGLFLVLGKRDIKVRYKQTILGVAWAILPPIFTMVIFSIIFGALAKVPSDGYPYPLYLFSALIPWQIFSRLLIEGSQSIVSAQELVKKAAFPRIIIVYATVLPVLFDALLAVLVYIMLMFYFDYPIGIGFLLCIPILIWIAITGIAIGSIFALFNVYFRDVAFGMSFISQFWFFMTPIVYPRSFLPVPFDSLQLWNPITPIIEVFRFAALGASMPPVSSLIISFIITLLLMALSFVLYGKLEGTLADRI